VNLHRFIDRSRRRLGCEQPPGNRLSEHVDRIDIDRDPCIRARGRNRHRGTHGG
jgi:hypothetical protein